MDMSNKKELDMPLDADSAKDLELDEAPKPTRKASGPSYPIPKTEESGIHDRLKGRQKKK